MVEFAGVTPAVSGREEFADAREGDRDADRGGEPDVRDARRRCRPTLLEKEKAIYRAQMENSGKPANVIDKIVEGKLGSFYEQVVLPDQAVDPRPDREDERRGRASPRPTRRSARSVTVTRFARLKVGEGAH